MCTYFDSGTNVWMFCFDGFDMCGVLYSMPMYFCVLKNIGTNWTYSHFIYWIFKIKAIKTYGVESYLLDSI